MIHSFVSNSFLLIVVEIPFCEYNTVCLSILLVDGNLGYSSFQVLQLKWLWAFLNKSFGGMFLFLLGKDPGVELLSHEVGVYLTL